MCAVCINARLWDGDGGPWATWPKTETAIPIAYQTIPEDN